MRCIKDILNETNEKNTAVDLNYNIYESRNKNEVPNADYDIYISSGGPGDPFDGEGTKWEKKYFQLMDKIWTNNQNSNRKKYVLYICHSFQIMARYFQIGDVIERRSKSFGIVPVHKTEIGRLDNILNGLPDIFYGADFRSWQVINPNKKVFSELGAKLISIEKLRPHVDLPRAMMAVRISNEIIGTQFHPEADIASMAHHFGQKERQQQVIDEYGEKKLKEMLDHLENPENITLTRNTVIPTFLNRAIKELSS
ncbi:MAG: GMP synthase [Ignavibacteriales bacterium]|nr:GMP synthase [Ignavibacteriales bacterium]MCB9258748.1 GMP synthase [Ignavibacteriales bacterium]